MVQDETYFETHDGTKLYLYRWSPVGELKAVLHVIHGMSEHALRYRPLAEKLTSAGIEVWAADQRGHGRTADLTVNKPEKGGLLGHCADGNGFIRVTADIRALNEEIRKTKNVPLFLLGHSWGSFIAQNYIEYSNSGGPNDIKIDGCILSGTKGPGDFMVKLGLPVMTMVAAIKGQRSVSRFARSLADGAYNKKYKPNRTSFDWLSRDEKEVDKFIEDPLCGFMCSTGFYRNLAKILYNIHHPDSMTRIDKNLPVYVFSGSGDPVGDMGKSPTALVNAYRNLGVKDCEFVLYPGARHEALNETNRDEVIDNLISWIKKKCE
ncbi:MAG: lysophospholipase [Treponema sp.]|jgi:alpha-beta hydrolase superfamily lysophospholipase|nr:lysophospholipase [Treponema sp.]